MSFRRHILTTSTRWKVEQQAAEEHDSGVMGQVRVRRDLRPVHTSRTSRDLGLSIDESTIWGRGESTSAGTAGRNVGLCVKLRWGFEEFLRHQMLRDRDGGIWGDRTPGRAPDDNPRAPHRAEPLGMRVNGRVSLDIKPDEVSDGARNWLPRSLRGALGA